MAGRPGTGGRPGSLRAGNGKFIASPDTAERDAEACRLRTRALSYREIAEQLGFRDETSAYNAVKRAMAATIAEPAEEVRRHEIERLDAMWKTALAIAERFHVTVSNGRVVYDGGGPVGDDGPALAAIDRLLRIQERRARLLGLDAPVKHEVRNVDAVDAEIEQLVARLAAGGQGSATPTPAAGSGAGRVPHPG